MKDNRFRQFAMFGALIWLFVCASVSDRWPELTVAAIAASFVGISIQFGAIAFLGRAKHRSESKSSFRKTDVLIDPGFQMAASRLKLEGEIDRMWATHAHLVAHDHAKRLVYQHMITRASDVSNWYLSDALRKIIEQGTYSRELASLDSIPNSLLKWKLQIHRPDTFTISAGAFEITNIDGRSTIVVTDRSMVDIVLGGASDEYKCWDPDLEHGAPVSMN